MPKFPSEIRKSIIVVFVCISLVSCNSGNSSEPTLDSPLITSSISPTSTVSKFPSNDLNPTTEATLSPIEINDLNPTTEATLSPIEIEERIYQVFAENEACRLPCWWNSTPGITTTTEFQKMLLPFVGAAASEQKYKFLEESGFIDFAPFSNGFNLFIHYSGSNELLQFLYISTAMVTPTEDGFEMDYENKDYKNIMAQFSPASVLNQFGKPEEIFVRFISTTAFPAQVSLYYQKEGFIVEYFSPTYRSINDELAACPNESLIKLMLFDPKESPSLESIFSYNDNFSKHRRLSDVTNLTIESFYEIYIIPDSEKCIITQPEMWPTHNDNLNDN